VNKNNIRLTKRKVFRDYLLLALFNYNKKDKRAYKTINKDILI
jgi:hypothetical protein